MNTKHMCTHQIQGVKRIYCDGGLLSRNPSELGGTYGYVMLGMEGDEIYRGSGIILPTDYGLQRITNNLSELYAVIAALTLMPNSWIGTVHTDSEVTAKRLRRRTIGGNLPNAMVDSLIHIRRRLDFDVKLVAGHPTRDELLVGARVVSQKGRMVREVPVSGWNKLCDQLCQEQSKSFHERNGTGDSKQPICSNCDSIMLVRESCYGKFWGCSNYPRCKQTANITT